MPTDDGARQTGRTILVPARWPYVNDFLDCRWLPNAPPFQEPALWIESPIESQALAVYYRLTPIVHAKLAVAVERLEAKSGDVNVREAVGLLLDLGTWLVHESGEYVARDIAAARRAVAAGNVAIPKPLATREQIEVLARIARRSDSDGVAGIARWIPPVQR